MYLALLLNDVYWKTKTTNLLRKILGACSLCEILVRQETPGVKDMMNMITDWKVEQKGFFQIFFLRINCNDYLFAIIWLNYD